MDSIPYIPHVKDVFVNCGESYYTMGKNLVKVVSSMCPNATSLDLYGTIREFPEVSQIIWSNMTKLESLDMEIDVSYRGGPGFEIDSALTGFSEKTCKKISKIIQKNGGQISLKELKKFDRRSPSILDLQGEI